ncbi:MAG TPA: malto-oligosyltrehalose trehalohydrolase [Longimicrobiales bacterium]
MVMAEGRRLPIGAEVLAGGGVHFRVWAPKRERVEVVFQAGPGAAVKSAELSPEGGGYFSGAVSEARAGTWYRFRLDGGDELFPDPASRFQPRGPHGWSEVVDPGAFAWTDAGWEGVRLEGQVIYELHVGTFTREGTWEAAARELPALAELGVTLIEVMPVADFPGRFGWGYDGVNLFAPTRLYGTPDDLRRFVDRAHALGIGVILDVVYNHLGPAGNYLRAFADDYFTDRYTNEWGEAINFDDRNCGPVREFILANAGYWIDEFHMDGLRLDATQAIHDRSPEHIIAAIVRRAREAAGGRSIVIVAENEPQDARLARAPEEGGCGVDALWNDDFHHAVTVALTGRREAYYADYHGTPQELISAVRRGFLYQGQYHRRQRKRRGRSTRGLEPATFIVYLQNHDQVANSLRGERIHALTAPGRYRAATALLLLAPGTPMLFQGQEFAASSPFLFFADHEEGVQEAVRAGRARFLSQFRSLGTPEAQAALPDPGEESFQRSKLDHGERERHAAAYALHRDLLRLRREDPVFTAQGRGGVDGAVLGPEAFALRFFGEAGDDRLLIVNLGRDLDLEVAAEPLLAPPTRAGWKILWSSEEPRYGGSGVPPIETEDGWRLPGHAAVVLAPLRQEG